MATYIKNIREFLGHQPIVLCTSTVIIVNSKNQILFNHRIDDNHWGLPGGIVEPAETVEEAAIREVFEETGLKVSNLQFLGVYSGLEMHHFYPNDDEVYFVDSAFVTYDYEGEYKADGEETKNVGFFDLDKIPQTISSTNIPLLKDFKKKYL